MSNLPYDAEIEYIESSGTQYINTGIKLFESGGLTTLEFSMDVYVNTGQADYSCIVNAMKEANPYPGVVIRTSGDNIQIARGNEASPPTIGTCGIFQSITRIENVSFQHDDPTTIFAGLNGSNAPWRYCKLKLYRLSIRKDSILLFDAYPVRIGQTGYLYDKVSGELFGNDGTGDFILGNDKALPNPFGFRRRLMMVGSSALPYDVEVEYLQSDGDSWIDTGVIPGSDYGYIIDCEILNTTSGNITCPIGSLNAWQSKMWGCQHKFDNNGFMFAYSNKYANSGRKISSRNVIKYYKGTVGVSAYTATLSGVDFEGEYTATLFGWNVAGDIVYQSPSKIWSAKIYYQTEDNLIRDFIPVRVGNVGYMYDRVTGRLFGNLGTGSFTLGPDVPTSYDAQVEYIETTGTQFIIDTDIYPTPLNISVLYEGESYLSFGWIYNNNGNNTWIAAVKDTIFWGKYNNSYMYTLPSFGDGYQTCEYMMNEGFYKESTLLKSFTASLGNTAISPIPLYLFTLYDANINSITSNQADYGGKIKWCKISRGGILLRDFIPVRVGQVGYIYDKISGKFFSNAGTGDFILGNDVN